MLRGAELSGAIEEEEQVYTITFGLPLMLLLNLRQKNYSPLSLSGAVPS